MGFLWDEEVLEVLRGHTGYTSLPKALKFGTAGGFMGHEACPPSSCRTSWFRQRSTWRLKITRSSLSWVTWHIGQMRTGPLSLHDWGRCEVTVTLSQSIDTSICIDLFFKLHWSSWGSALLESIFSLFFAPSSSTSLSPLRLPATSHSVWLFSRSKSDSESDWLTAIWFGFLEASLRHWSMCLLKTVKSVVSTSLKHTGQVKLSDTVLPKPDVDAWASTGATKSFSEASEAVQILSCTSVDASRPFCVHVGVTTEVFSPCFSSCVLAFATWSCILLAWALWKKDCWGSPPVLLPSKPLCFLQLVTSSLWHVCARGREARVKVCREWLERCSFSSFWCIPCEARLKSVLSGWRKPTMLFCRGFLSSELTKAEILTPTSTKTNHLERKPQNKWQLCYYFHM